MQPPLPVSLQHGLAMTDIPEPLTKSPASLHNVNLAFRREIVKVNGAFLHLSYNNPIPVNRRGCVSIPTTIATGRLLLVVIRLLQQMR